jgi:UDP:flavonoid glycosyltransferase YjiC (YdhE family)
VPVVACPAAGDMGENAARVAWAGVGVSLPRRMTTPRGVRLAARKVLGDPAYAERAGELKRWSEGNDGTQVAADAVESLLAGTLEPASAGVGT